MRADIVQWIRLRLATCGQGFKSHAHHLYFFYLYVGSQILHYICPCVEKERKYKQKEAGFGDIYKIISQAVA